MSVRKMRLVSEALYKQLFQKDPEKPDILLEQKEQVLQRKDIPDDVKSQLYHHAVRNLASSLKEAEAHPLPVSTKKEPSAYDNELDRKTKMLESWLAVNDFAELENGNFTIGGIPVGNTKFNTLKKHMLGLTPSKSKVPDGYDDAKLGMEARGMKEDYFKVKGQKGSGVKRAWNKRKNEPVKKKSTKKKTMKKNFKQIMWKSY